MKKLVLIICLSLFSIPALAASCGEGDINIDFSKLGAKGKTMNDYIRVVDASTLKVKENKDDRHPRAMDVTGVVSRKALCVGELYCFVARRYLDGKNKMDFRWEPLRKDNPDAKGGTQSRVYVAANFEKSTITSVNAPMLISRNPTMYAVRKENVTMEFRRPTDGAETHFTVAVREGKIEIRGPGKDGAPRIDLNLNNAAQSKKVEMSTAKNIVFQPYEQNAYEEEDRNAHDPVTNRRLKATKSKPVAAIELNCLRETVEDRGQDILKPNGKPGGSGGKL